MKNQNYLQQLIDRRNELLARKAVIAEKKKQRDAAAVSAIIVRKKMRDARKIQRFITSLNKKDRKQHLQRITFTKKVVIKKSMRVKKISKKVALRVPEPQPIQRPPAVYSNRSPYGIASDLHFGK